MRRRRSRNALTAAAPVLPGRSRAVFLALAGVAVVLLATMDARHVGIVADGRQMVWTAVAIAETGQLGQARARDLTVPRAQGDAVSRYGLGMSFAQVPAAHFAAAVEERFGYGSSQPLFLVAPLSFILAAAAFAAWAAALMGAGVHGRVAAVLLTTIGSPLGSYAAMELSESLQAAALAATFAASLAACRTPSGQAGRFAQFAGAAGAAAGVAVLAKSSLIIVAPFALIPLLTCDRIMRVRAALFAAVGFVPVTALWLWLELQRFGRPFASYAGEGFTHPFFDGAWRLLVGPNKGLIVYFPAVLVACWAFARLVRSGQTRRALEGSPAILVLVALLSLAAPWWAWHGVDGWGPRLLVAAIPLVAAVVGLEVDRWAPRWRTALIAGSVLLNVPPLLQHPTPVMTYIISCRWPAVDERTASTLPRFAERRSDDAVLVSPDQILAVTPEASQLLVLPWFAFATWQSDTEAARRLNSPPWRGARPDIRPQPPLSPEAARALTGYVEWHFWGRELLVRSAQGEEAAVYVWGLEDQVIRAQQLRQVDDALRLAKRLVALAPTGHSDAWLIETYRLLHAREDARRYLLSLPDSRRAYPTINIVLALFERDAGNLEGARALMLSVAGEFDDPVMRERINRAPAEWPPDLAAFTAAPEEEVPLVESEQRP